MQRKKMEGRLSHLHEMGSDMVFLGEDFYPGGFKFQVQQVNDDAVA